MYTYSVAQWLFFFYAYCFIGWMIESTYVSLSQKKFVNRGFLKSPMLPLYGFGAISVLFITLPFSYNSFLVYVVGMISATLLEYITGCLMEWIFGMKYWDYSNEKMNFQGKICLKSTMFWGFLSLLLTEVIHDTFAKYTLKIDGMLLTVIVSIISAIFTVDTIYSFHTAYDLSKILAKLNRIKEETDRLREQLGNLKESAQDEIGEIKKKISDKLDEREKIFQVLGKLKSNIIRIYPSMYSNRFNGALKEVRERLSERVKSMKK